MSWVAIAVTAVSVGASAYGAASASDSASAAQKQNKENTEDTNKLNLRLFREARGMPTASGDVSSVLPYYLNEAGIAQKAQEYFDSISMRRGTPEDQFDLYESLIQQMRPSIAAGDRFVEDIASGEITNRRLMEAEPVFAARQQVAAGQKQGILEALSAQLNALKAQRARAGFVGASRMNRNQDLAFSIPARQAAATEGSRATLANAMDRRSILSAGDDLRLRTIDLPASRAAQAIALQKLPFDTTTADFLASMKPFDFFRIAPNAFRSDSLPTVQPIPGIGQIVGASVGAGANTASNYYLTQKLLEAYANQNQRIPSSFDQQYLNEWGSGG